MRNEFVEESTDRLEEPLPPAEGSSPPRHEADESFRAPESPSRLCLGSITPA
jgi:hypothetical protein